jgi:hypothetical protein
MNHSCAQILDQIVDLAEGKGSPEALAHVHTCDSCAGRLREFTAMIQAVSFPMVDVPMDVLARAQRLMPERAPSRRFRLVTSSFGLAGARRGPAQDFQIVVGAESQSVRLMYKRVGAGWEVIGRAPSGEWILSRPEQEVKVDREGHFSFQASDLASSAFSLLKDGERIDVPSAEELLEERPSN